MQGFIQHGVKVLKESSGQTHCICPFCRKPKFYCNKETLLWDCKRCGISGNFEQFLLRAHALEMEMLTRDALRKLANDRSITSQTLRAWGVGRIGDVYTYPVYTMQGGNISDLRRYEIGGKPRATKGGHSGLMRPLRLTNSKRVWVCEGEWDGMALYEILRKNKIRDDVFAVCGANNFPKRMADYFNGKDVVLIFDHDEAGERGLTRTWNLLDGIASSRRRMQWSGDLPAGFDLRDIYLTHNRDAVKAFRALNKGLTTDLPQNAQNAPQNTQNNAPQTQINAHTAKLTGKGLKSTYVLKKYQESLELPHGEALDVIYGSVFANRIDADPLWIFLVAPPGGSKSELLMTLTDAPLIYCTTSLTPHSLISGMNFGGGDPSLIPKILGKTLVVKDFTTILSLNQTAREEIFGILRDAYDGKIKKTFGNNVTREYRGTFGVIAGVTPVIDSTTHANSVLGERFIKYRIRQRGKINVGKKVIMRALDNITHESSMREKLMEVAAKVLDREITRDDYPKLPKWFKERAMELAQWVSVLRGSVNREKYTNRIAFKPTSEIGTRLAKQFCILGLGIGVYRQVKELDEDIYQIISHVARDTAPDKVEEIVKQMFVRCKGDSASTTEISEWTRFPFDSTRALLEDLEMLHVVRRDTAGRGRWKLYGPMVQKMERLNMYRQEIAWVKK